MSTPQIERNWEVTEYRTYKTGMTKFTVTRSDGASVKVTLYSTGVWDTCTVAGGNVDYRTRLRAIATTIRFLISRAFGSDQS
jgi:hypothetical protein